MATTITRSTSNRRLLKLADFLARLSRKQFNFGHYAGEDWAGAPDLSCGTTACALGWAAAMPAFQRLGLHLVRKRYGVTVALKGSRLDADHAGAKIFGISSQDAFFLFNPNASYFDPAQQSYDYGRRAPNSDATPKQVAAHIRAFVRRRP